MYKIATIALQDSLAANIFEHVVDILRLRSRDRQMGCNICASAVGGCKAIAVFVGDGGLPFIDQVAGGFLNSLVVSLAHVVNLLRFSVSTYPSSKEAQCWAIYLDFLDSLGCRQLHCSALGV